ncbi:hypothetical protein ACVIHI_008110 [Bradyrhizobium sp. USDA 4524]|uniref:hypothetical protein n=1 Tax=Bradyrhizobium TaxID=374 RepID=UPI000841ADCE|nr:MULTISPECIES: hypothetical protein [Bradyrhizobium]MCP1838971.1 hypothetical protein [Bradyrhizobium sp. USDA 4538]MCP1899538.1 hypothetical protein [Bradyrhizobium sp. USDA 4537]MCP1909825.1 hypothetical protein [Bradyrhizobium elkanii]MCP1986353.1 hypothetical protein [Bradyrhizobium sp. USDA 4539]ODM71575.1 hypothetical protein A6X20_41080 [Bradyrhizobium elkanii]
MTRLPQRSVELGTAFQGINNEHHAPAVAPATPQASGIGIDKVHGKGGNAHTSVVQDRAAQERLAANTIDNALELKSIDPISRINPTDATEHADKIGTNSELAWLNGPNLADSLLSFVTPRLRHSHVVRPEQHGLLLERLADALSAAPEGSVAREGAALLRLELRRLILLRQNHNGLIQG